MYLVDLNCDLGESFGNYKCGMDEEVIPFITSANVACGFHASDPAVMAGTVALAKKNNVRVGAHPGFRDLAGFGRRNMAVPPEEVKAMVQYQIGALQAFCSVQGIRMSHVKLHGALYNMAGKDEKLARAVCEGIYEVNHQLILLALAGSKMLKAAEDTGLKAAREVFADRAYEEDGSLVQRGREGAVITDEDEAGRRAVRMVKEGKVKAITGKEIQVEADSICVHGDGEKALQFVDKISRVLKAEGIRKAPLEEVIEARRKARDRQPAA